MPYADVEKKRLRERNRRRKQTADKQEIGLPPKRKNAIRWKRACGDFRFFCETYFRDKNEPDSTFRLDWSPDHLEVIGQVEKTVTSSQQFIVVMPRGSGKSSLLEISIIWAILTGHRRFGVLVASTAQKALDIVREIKSFLIGNEKLISDFGPELYGLVKLEDEARKCKGQKCNGQRTGVEWTSRRIVFPTVPDSAASGAVLAVSGMKGAIEGQKHVPVGGKKMIRPDIVLIDDPQTRESAKSPKQSANRIEFINAGIKGLGGPKKGVSVLAAATIMQPNDLTSQLLDRQRNPGWRGKVYHAVRKFPDELLLWDQYNQIRVDRGEVAATAFYRENRKAMDAGAEVYWPERFHPEKHEFSGIQHLMNLFYDDRKVFWSEYQNQPEKEGALVFHLADRETIESLCLDIPAGIAHESAAFVVAHIDIQKRLLYFTITAFSQDFTCRKLFHGTYPDQHLLHFIRERPSVSFPGWDADNDKAIYNALTELVSRLSSQRWQTAFGRKLGANLITIDDRFKRDVVHRVVGEFGPHVMPYQGLGINAKKKAIADYSRSVNTFNGVEGKILERCYENVRGLQNGQPVVLGADVSALKTFMHERLKIPAGLSGSVSFCGAPTGKYSSLEFNDYFIDHLYSEEPFLDVDEPSGRQKIVWKNEERKQNDWLDCFAANFAAAELLGCSVKFQRATDTDVSTGTNYTPPQRGFRAIR